MSVSLPQTWPLPAQPTPHWMREARARRWFSGEWQTRASAGVSSYDTSDVAVSLHDALSVGFTGAGLAVGAEPGTVAACHLVTREASLTFSTAEGALVKTARSQNVQQSLTSTHSLHGPHLSVVALWVGSAASVLRWQQTLVYVVTYLGKTHCTVHKAWLAQTWPGMNAWLFYLLVGCGVRHPHPIYFCSIVSQRAFVTSKTRSSIHTADTRKTWVQLTLEYTQNRW